MRRFWLSLCIFLLVTVALQAQLLPFMEYGRWGLCSQRGTRLTDGWDSVRTDGWVAALWRNDTIRLYHPVKALQPPAGITDVRLLDSVVAVLMGGKWGLISKSTMDTVVFPQYDSIRWEPDILVGISGKKMDLLTPGGKFLMPTVSGKRAVGTTNGWVIWVVNDTLKGLLHPSGVEIPAKYQRFRIMPPLIWACANSTDWYLYNDQGTLLHE